MHCCGERVDRGVIGLDVIAMGSQTILQSLARRGLVRSNDDADRIGARAIRQQLLHRAIDL